MGWFKTSVSANVNRVSVARGLSSTFMLWDNVFRVYGEKLDKITYEELFLVLEDSDGLVLAVGEMDQGFSEFEAEIYVHLDKFPGDWRQKLDSIASGVRDQLWCRKNPGQ
jgi:hypothetical protein